MSFAEHSLSIEKCFTKFSNLGVKKKKIENRCIVVSTLYNYSSKLTTSCFRCRKRSQSKVEYSFAHFCIFLLVHVLRSKYIEKMTKYLAQGETKQMWSTKKVSHKMILEDTQFHINICVN